VLHASLQGYDFEVDRIIDIMDGGKIIDEKCSSLFILFSSAFLSSKTYVAICCNGISFWNLLAVVIMGFHSAVFASVLAHLSATCNYNFIIMLCYFAFFFCSL
jgi:hypothetical protein